MSKINDEPESLIDDGTVQANAEVVIGKIRNVRDAAFAKRLEQASDHHQYVPALSAGRLVWIRRQLTERFGILVSMETVRKWFYGETRPRPDKMTKLAELLEVDEAWLSIGYEPELQPREQRARNAVADGAVNLLAGVIQMNGGSPAFPEADDPRVTKEHIDLYAIIRGAQYAFHVSLGQQVDGGIRFVVPSNSSCFQMGVIQVAPTEFKFLEVSSELIESKGVAKGASAEVTLSDAEISAALITSFARRI